MHGYVQGGGRGRAHLLAQQCTGSRGCREGLLRGPLAHLLELVLNKVFQGSELRLAAATSVHIVLICNEPVVGAAREGLQRWVPLEAAAPSPALSEGLRKLLEAQGASPHPLGICRSGVHPRESRIQQVVAPTVQLGCGEPQRLLWPKPPL